MLDFQSIDLIWLLDVYTHMQAGLRAEMTELIDQTNEGSPGATRAGNRMLSEMIRICHHVPVSSTRNIVVFEYHDVRRRHDDHHRIFEAVVAREPWRAEMLMREHVASIKTSLVGYLSERKTYPTAGFQPAEE